MLPARIRLFLTRVFTVTIVALLIGGNLAFAAPLAPSAAVTDARLLATLTTHTEGSILSGTTVYAPTGAVFCLVHESDILAFLDTTLPFPNRVTSNAVIGCDRVLAAGTTYVVDYNASNSPKFAQFVADFTNATDEPFSIFGQTVRDDLMPDGLGIGGGYLCESIIGKHRFARTCTPRNLLTGATIDFIRMKTSNIVITLSAGGTNLAFSADVTWQFYGHR